MNPAFIYLIKVVLCSGALYAYYMLALRNRLFHHWNRFYLLAAVLFSLAFPLIPLPLLYDTQKVNAGIPIYGLLFTTGSESVVHANSGFPWNWKITAWTTYACVGLVLLSRLVFGLLRIRKLLKQNGAQQLGSVSFIPTDHPTAPFSFFSWLFWKKDIELDSDGGQSIFRHELVHIHEKHSLDKLLMQLVLAVFWINPFFWMIRRELQMIHEFIADKKAVGDAGTEALASMILQSVYGKQFNELINPFFQQPIKRRLAMLQKTLKQPRNAYLGRVFTLPLCALLLFAFSKSEKNEKAPDHLKYETNTKIEVGQVKQEAIGTNQLSDTLPKKVNADDIKEVHVNTKDADKTITITYKNGKKETLTEKQAKERGLLKPPPPPPVPGDATTPPPPPPPPPMNENVLVVVDGKVKGTLKETGKLDNLFKQEEIESINVLKNEYATDKYGSKGKYGVIEITLKKASGAVQSDSNAIFEKVEQPPTFPGGEKAWRAFLEKNLNASVPVDNGAPAGTYKTMLQFKVAPDGTISDVTTLSSHGYGMEAEVLKLMHGSPKWNAAEQNGHKVTALHKQQITFVVAEE
jgi:hypothetical protein